MKKQKVVHKKEKFAHFKFPQSLLQQIDECSKGFVLFAVNDQNKFEVYRNMEDPVTAFGLINFIGTVGKVMQESLKASEE